MVVPSLLWSRLAGSLRDPTDLDFSAAGTMFVTERAGRLHVKPSRQAPLSLLWTSGQLGWPEGGELLSVAVDPGFERTRRIYLLVGSSLPARGALRVLRLTVAMAPWRVTELKVIWTKAAAAPAVFRRDGLAGVGPARLRFGPDGHLHVVALDEGDGSLASAGSGVLRRLHRGGRPVGGSLRVDDVDASVVVDGMHRLMALNFIHGTDRLLLARQSPDGQHEIGMLDGAGSARPLARVDWHGVPVDGPSSMVRLRNPAWKSWDDAWLVASRRSRRLDLLKLDAHGRTQQSAALVHAAGVGFAAMAQGPDGVHVVTLGKLGGDEVWMLTPL